MIKKSCEPFCDNFHVLKFQRLDSWKPFQLSIDLKVYFEPN